MTLTELRYLVALARERHFGRAAQACFVSQPTLSVAVRRLEDEIGVVLFERGRQEVVLTPIGQRIVEQAQRVLEEAETLKQIAATGQDPLSGPLRLGAIHTVGPYLLPHLIPILNEQAPSMRLLVEENYTARLRERLRQGELDVIVISLPFGEPGLMVQPVYEEPFVVVLPASHPWNERKAVSVHDLATEPVLLLGPGHCFRDQVLEVCPDCLQTGWGNAGENGGLQKALEGSSLETVRHMVASGVGVTVLPCTAAAADQYSRRLLSIRRFADIHPSRRVALAWRRKFPRPQAIEALRRAILACPLTCVRMLDLPPAEAGGA